MLPKRPTKEAQKQWSKVQSLDDIRQWHQQHTPWFPKIMIDQLITSYQNQWSTQNLNTMLESKNSLMELENNQPKQNLLLIKEEDEVDRCIQITQLANQIKQCEINSNSKQTHNNNCQSNSCSSNSNSSSRSNSLERKQSTHKIGEKRKYCKIKQENDDEDDDEIIIPAQKRVLLKTLYCKTDAERVQLTKTTMNKFKMMKILKNYNRIQVNTGVNFTPKIMNVNLNWETAEQKYDVENRLLRFCQGEVDCHFDDKLQWKDIQNFKKECMQIYNFDILHYVGYREILRKFYKITAKLKSLQFNTLAAKLKSTKIQLLLKNLYDELSSAVSEKNSFIYTVYIT